LTVAGLAAVPVDPRAPPNVPPMVPAAPPETAFDLPPAAAPAALAAAPLPRGAGGGGDAAVLRSVTLDRPAPLEPRCIALASGVGVASARARSRRARSCPSWMRTFSIMGDGLPLCGFCLSVLRKAGISASTSRQVAGLKGLGMHGGAGRIEAVAGRQRIATAIVVAARRLDETIMAVLGFRGG